jgi:hypothetical protein
MSARPGASSAMKSRSCSAARAMVDARSRRFHCRPRRTAHAPFAGELSLTGPANDLFAGWTLALKLRRTASRWLMRLWLWSGPEPEPR